MLHTLAWRHGCYSAQLHTVMQLCHSHAKGTSAHMWQALWQAVASKKEQCRIRHRMVSYRTVKQTSAQTRRHATNPSTKLHETATCQ